MAFYDDALLMQADKRIKPILWAVLESGRRLRFHTPNGLHGRYIDEELAGLMYRNNFKTIRIQPGISRQRTTAQHSQQDHPGEMTRAVRNLVKAGYKPAELETYIIMGLPHQPLDEVTETILYANSLGVQVRLASFSPIPGTEDYARAMEKGVFPVDADPLLTNKTVIPLFRTAQAYARFQKISQFAKELNNRIRDASVFKADQLPQSMAMDAESL